VLGGTMLNRYNVNVIFAYRSFKWESEAGDKAAVHCVIIGFSCEKIEKTGQGILDARELYPDSSLADLYDDLTMPPELPQGTPRK